MVTAHNVTTKKDIVKPLQYVGETDVVTSPTSYGTTPSSAVFIIVGNTVEINEQPDIQHLDVGVLGSEDIIDEVKTGSLYAFSFKYLPISNVLADFVIDPSGGGVGSIDESLSFTWSENLDGVEFFHHIRGFVPTSITGTIARGTWEYDITGVCKDITIPSSSDGNPGTAVYLSAETSTSPISHIDGGASPFTWNTQAFGERRFSFTITRDVAVIAVNGESDIIYAKNAGRNIQFSTDVFIGFTGKETDIQTDWEGKTPRTATYEIGSDTITFTKSVLTGFSEAPAAGTTDAMIQSITARAESVAIA